MKAAAAAAAWLRWETVMHFNAPPLPLRPNPTKHRAYSHAGRRINSVAYIT